MGGPRVLGHDDAGKALTRTGMDYEVTYIAAQTARSSGSKAHGSRFLPVHRTDARANRSSEITALVGGLDLEVIGIIVEHNRAPQGQRERSAPSLIYTTTTFTFGMRHECFVTETAVQSEQPVFDHCVDTSRQATNMAGLTCRTTTARHASLLCLIGTGPPASSASGGYSNITSPDTIHATPFTLGYQTKLVITDAPTRPRSFNPVSISAALEAL